jgi:hypothetical protein
MSNTLVKLICRSCEIEYEGQEPQTCCSGRDCGCMGQPIEPILCDDCYVKMMESRKSQPTPPEDK